MKISKNNLMVMFIVLLLTALFDNVIFEFPTSAFWFILSCQLALALLSVSSIGSFVVRFLFNAREPATREELERIQNLFEEVYAEVKVKYPKIQKNIKYYIDDGGFINAYAIGYNTIVITRGSIMHLNDEELKGIIGHEFGHIVRGDTALQSFLLVGNSVFFIIWLMIKVFHLIFFLVSAFTDDDFILSRFWGFLSRSLMYLVLFIVDSLLLINARACEFQADKFSYDLGFGEGLLRVLYQLDTLEYGVKKTPIDRIKSSHPNTIERIGALERLLLRDEILV